MPTDGTNPIEKIDALDDIAPPEVDDIMDNPSAAARQNKENAPSEPISARKHDLDDIADAGQSVKLTLELLLSIYAEICEEAPDDCGLRRLIPEIIAWEYRASYYSRLDQLPELSYEIVNNVNAVLVKFAQCSKSLVKAGIEEDQSQEKEFVFEIDRLNHGPELTEDVVIRVELALSSIDEEGEYWRPRYTQGLCQYHDHRYLD